MATAFDVIHNAINPSLRTPIEQTRAIMQALANAGLQIGPVCTCQDEDCMKQHPGNAFPDYRKQMPTVGDGELVERIARAIFGYHAQGQSFSANLSEHDEETWNYWTGYAEQALNALRTATTPQRR